MEDSPKKGMATWKKVLFGLVAFIVLANIYGAINPSPKVESLNDQSDSISTTSTADASDVPKSNWDYSEDKDKMSDAVNYFASNLSTNTISFEFPYNGGSTFFLTVRNKDGRNGVILTVSKGQFIGGIGSDGSIKVKFDDEKSVEYPFGRSSDGSSDVIFIHNEKRFISKLKSAKKLKIEAEFYQAGNQVIEFDVDGFEWKK